MKACCSSPLRPFWRLGMELEALGQDNVRLCVVAQTLGSLSFHPDSFFLLTLLILPPPTAFQGPTSYHVIQILTFANSTWPQGQSSGWLDDFQIHGWDSDSGTATFLKPWSKGNFSDEEIIELEGLFQAYFIGFTKKVQEYVSKVQIECEYSPLLRGDSQWFFSLLVKAITLLDLGPVLPLYPTACTHFSRVVSNSDSTPPTSIPDSSCFLHPCVINEGPPL